jgi:(1->4)-alpha-D-glucan 1-alpha-D-glucosylmutase
VEEVHRRVAARGRRWPASLVATSTHDTKRGEDVRARIDVLSEMPGAWGAAVRRWSDLNAPLRGRVGDREAPSPAEELLLYQTLVGTWPLEGGPGNAFVRRIERYLEKAVREAKVSSSWLEPDAAYERALLRFARRALRSGPFVEELEAFAGRVAYHGALNGLAQVVLRSIVPGVPDLYQGSEGWNLSLVDPDNRGPVDAERLARRLRSVNRAPDPVAMLGRWRDGDVKRFVTSRALRLRRDRPDLFAGGAYVPVAATGRHAPSVVAAARRRGGAWALAVVPRLTTRLVGPDRWPVGPNVWGRTALALPRGAPSSWRDALTGDEVGTARSGGIVPVASALRRFPVALLVADRRDPALAT